MARDNGAMLEDDDALFIREVLDQVVEVNQLPGRDMSLKIGPTVSSKPFTKVTAADSAFSTSSRESLMQSAHV